MYPGNYPGSKQSQQQGYPPQYSQAIQNPAYPGQPPSGHPYPPQNPGHGQTGYPAQHYPPPGGQAPPNPGYGQTSYPPPGGAPPAQQYPAGTQQHQAIPPRNETIQWQAPPANYMQQHSAEICSLKGQKKALLIGINYTGTSAQLSGCINDVKMIHRFLVDNFGFSYNVQSTVVLTDDNPNPAFRPTRENIIQAMKWLVRGTRSGDSLFFHFSGHGATVADKDGDEADGLDNTICPVDFKKNGQIIDDEMNVLMVRNLPQGVRLTAIYDCCHSGSALDLPLTYECDGSIKQNKTGLDRYKGSAIKIGTQALKGNYLGAAMSAFSLLNQATGPTKSQEQLQAEKGNMFADVIMLSGYLKVT
jgi:hypothetical protein